MAGPQAQIGPMATRLNRYFQGRTERERIIFEKVREIVTLPTILRRRALARQMAADRPFTIDQDRGFALFPPGTFPEVEEIIAATRGLDHLDAAHRAVSKKAQLGFMVPMLDGQALTPDSPLLRFALRPDVISAVTSYLGILPVISRLNVYYSEAGSGAAKSSQLFHCDADSTKQIKIFILCTEVTPAHGPLTVVDASTSRTLRQQVSYHFGDKLKDKQFARLLGPQDLHPIVGPAGTACFVDTTQCFHFGSRVETGVGPRLVTIIQYLSPSSFMLPRDHRLGSPFRHLMNADLSQVQRLVLGLA